MGYDTYWSGELTITPELRENDLRILKGTLECDQPPLDVFDTSDTRTEIFKMKKRIGLDKSNSLWLLVPINATTISTVSEEARSYDFEEQFKALVKHFFVARGYTLEGALDWTGEQNDDTGTVYVKDNKVEFVPDKHWNPGPSWDRQPAPEES